MVHYPQTFHAETSCHKDIKENWSAHVSEHELTCSIPKLYEGSGEAFSPEDLYLLSLQNCFVATYKVYAEHMNLEFDTLTVSADLVIDIEEGHGPVMKNVEMNIELSGVSEEALAQELVEKSLASGFIFQSIKTKVTSVINIT